MAEKQQEKADIAIADHVEYDATCIVFSRSNPLRGGARMTRFLTLVVVGIAMASTLAVAESQRIHVTAEVVQQAFSNAPSNPPQLGDWRVNNVKLFNKKGDRVGTGTSHCTIVSIPPRNILEQCLLTALFEDGQIVFGGVAPAAVPGARARFGIVGGTDDFRKARGEVLIVLNLDGTIDVFFDIE
jgi:hypothetical protein